MFFVLSGYSLAHAYGAAFESGIRQADLRRYFQRRLGRLGPLFVTVLVLSVAGKLFITHNAPDPIAVFANAVLLFGFFDPSSSPVVGGWSIGVEVVFYFGLPMVLLAQRGSLAVLAASVLFAIWISVELQRYSTLADGWRMYVHPANHLIFFVGGICLRQFDQWTGSVRLRWMVALALASAVVLLAAAQDATELDLVTGWRRAVLVIASLAFVGAIARLPMAASCHPAADVAAGISYPLYLIHPLVYFALKGRVEMATAWPFLVVVVLVGAWLVDRFVDAPLQQRVKAFGW